MFVYELTTQLITIVFVFLIVFSIVGSIYDYLAFALGSAPVYVSYCGDSIKLI